MKKTIKLLFLVVLLLVLSKPITLIADVSQVTNCYVGEPAKSCVERFVDIYSKEYHVNAKQMMVILKGEDSTFDPSKQSDLLYKKGNRWGFKAGVREKSYGVAQIHLPDHPNITLGEAENVPFSIKFMAQEFSKGKISEWSSYK